MEIRDIATPEELERSRALCYIAFEFNIDDEPSPRASAERILNDPVTRMKQRYENTMAAFDGNGEMQACLSRCTADVAFDGGKVKLLEVGDVASMPGCRGQGVVKELFRTMLLHAHDNGVEFSALYPFSGSYYRQYGYEYCQRLITWQLRLSLLPRFNTGGSLRLYTPALTGDLKRVYNAFVLGRNLSTVREDIEWYNTAGRFDPAVDKVFTYIYYSKDGEPLGYMTYHNQADTQGSIMRCTQFAYANREGLLGLLDYARSRQAQHNYISLPLPEDVRPELVIPEFNLSAAVKNSMTLSMHGMVRVVNLKNALFAARFEGDGDIVMQLDDGYLPQNNGVWRLQWHSGRCTVFERTDSPPSLRLDISLFSSLLCGGLSPCDLALLPPGCTQADGETLLRLFPRKRVGLFEYY